MLEAKELKNKNFGIFMGMPAYGGTLSATTCSSLLDLQNWCRDNNINFYYHFLVNESLVTRARNEIVASMMDFKNFNVTHLLFIDSDIGFSTTNIERLICSEKDIVCGIYPSKGIYWESVKNSVKNNPDINVEDLLQRAWRFVKNYDSSGKNIFVEQLSEIYNSGPCAQGRTTRLYQFYYPHMDSNDYIYKLLVDENKKL